MNKSAILPVLLFQVTLQDGHIQFVFFLNLARKALFERTRRTLTDPESTFETKLSPAMQE